MISPAVALSEVERTLTVMARAAKENVELSLAQLKAYDPKVTDTINRYEERLDDFADQADNYPSASPAALRPSRTTASSTC